MSPAGGRRYTMREVIDVYRADKWREELFGEWGAALVYRPLSFLVTPWLLNAPVGATTVTVAALLVVLALPGLALIGGTVGHVTLGLGAMVVAVLDCVDGNIARTTGQSDRLGHYVDFVTDIVFRFSFYVSIALLIAAQPFATTPVAGHAMVIAIAAAWLAVAARLSRIYAEYRLMGRNPYEAPGEADGAPPGLGDRLFAVLSGIDPLMPLVVIAAGHFGGLDWVLVWLLVYSAADFVLTQVTIVRGLKP